jgi:release factor glutamine methyltransferase
VSAGALAVARRNAERLGLAIELLEASWWHGLEGRRFDIAIANPPYIAGDDPHLATLMHEPALALTPGGDGLGALRAIVAGASAPLLPGGWLFLEHGFDQAGRRARAARRSRFRGSRDAARPGRPRAGDRRSAARRSNRRSQAIPSVAKVLCTP